MPKHLLTTPSQTSSLRPCTNQQTEIIIDFVIVEQLDALCSLFVVWVSQIV